MGENQRSAAFSNTVASVRKECRTISLPRPRASGVLGTRPKCWERPTSRGQVCTQHYSLRPEKPTSRGHPGRDQTLQVGRQAPRPSLIPGSATLSPSQSLSNGPRSCGVNCKISAICSLSGRTICSTKRSRRKPQGELDHSESLLERRQYRAGGDHYNIYSVRGPILYLNS